MSQPTINAVLFDLDGTLVDSLPTIADAMVETLARHGYQHPREEIMPLIGPPMNVLIEDLTGISPEDAARMNEDYLRIYYEQFIELTPEHEGASALLDELAAAGRRLAVVTNKVEHGGREMVRIQGWDHYFGEIVGRDTAAAAKPSPLAAQYAMRSLEASPDETGIVGDTEYDMQCGRDTGLPMVIGVVGARTEAHLRAHGATHVVHALHEVAPVILGAGVPS